MCVSTVSYVLEQVFLLSYDNSLSWKPVNKTVSYWNYFGRHMKRTDGFMFIALCTSTCMFSCTSDVDIKTIWKRFQDKEKVSSEDRVAVSPCIKYNRLISLQVYYKIWFHKMRIYLIFTNCVKLIHGNVLKMNLIISISME